MYRIKNAFSFLDARMVNLLYKSFVRPHLEFAVAVWNPFSRTDIELLERVKRRASKLPTVLRNLPYPARLAQLKWTTLEIRRIRGDLMQWHKIQHGHEIVTLTRGFPALASAWSRQSCWTNQTRQLGN